MISSNDQPVSNPQVSSSPSPAPAIRRMQAHGPANATSGLDLEVRSRRFDLEQVVVDHPVPVTVARHDGAAESLGDRQDQRVAE